MLIEKKIMKSKIYFFVIIYCVIGFVYSIGLGYGLHSILLKAGVNSFNYEIKAIKSAHIVNGDLELCLFGDIDGDRTAEFSLKIPVTQFNRNANYLDTIGIYTSEFRPHSVELSRQYVHDDCKLNSNSNKIFIAVHKIKLSYGSITSAEDAAENLLQDFSENLVVNEVTVINPDFGHVEKAKTILVISKEPIINRSKFVYVSIKNRVDRGSFGWYFLTPLGILFDITSFPYQIYKWSKYKG